MFAQARDAWRIVLPRLFWIDGLRAAQRWPALRQNEILDRDRNTVEQALRLAVHPALFRSACLRERRFLVNEADRVDVRVKRLDAAEQIFGDFDGRDIFGAVGGDELRRGHPVQVGHAYLTAVCAVSPGSTSEITRPLVSKIVTEAWAG